LICLINSAEECTFTVAFKIILVIVCPLPIIPEWYSGIFSGVISKDRVLIEYVYNDTICNHSIIAYQSFNLGLSPFKLWVSD